MVNFYEADARLFFSNGEASVGATGSTELTSVDIPDGWAVRLIRAEADFTGTSLISNDRGFIIEEQLSGGNTNLARSKTDGTFMPQSEALTYHNNNGETATLAINGFHGDTVSHDMFAHQTWKGLNRN